MSPIEICLDGVEAWQPDIEPEPEQRCDDCGTALRDLHRDALTGDWLCGPCFFKRPDAHADGTLVDEPEDAEQDHGLGEIPSYPVDCLPSPARALVETSTVPDSLVAGAALAALAAAIGVDASLQVRPGWRERAILWVVNLAPRGAGKSPAQDIAFRPLRDRDAALGDDTRRCCSGTSRWRRWPETWRAPAAPGPWTWTSWPSCCAASGSTRAAAAVTAGACCRCGPVRIGPTGGWAPARRPTTRWRCASRAPPWSSAAACSPRCTRCSAATRTACVPAGCRTSHPSARCPTRRRWAPRVGRGRTCSAR